MRWSCVGLLDLLYPASCPGCGDDLAGQPNKLCWDCQGDVRPIGPPLCAHCGNPVEGRIDHAYRCYHCTQETPHFDLARCAVRFEGVAARLIHALKYDEALWTVGPLTDWLEACWNTLPSVERPDQLVAVPLHPARFRERGYNQSAVLANALAPRLGIRLAARVLIRTRLTPTQTRLTAKERTHNVRDSFQVPSPRAVSGQRILLVDDVMTTGATVNECARTLKAAGAASVSVLAIARGG